MDNQIEVSKLTTDQIKAFKCDCYEDISRCNENIRIANIELEKRRLDFLKNKDAKKEEKPASEDKK